MSIAIGAISIITYGALLAIGFAIGKEITNGVASIWLKSKEKVFEWQLKRNGYIWPDLDAASAA